jgi:hypothetical protein
MYWSQLVTERKRKWVSALGVAAMLASGRAAQAQWSPPSSPSDLVKNAIGNVAKGYDPTVNPPATVAKNIAVGIPVAQAAIGAAGVIAASEVVTNVMQGRDPNAPPPQTYSTLSNSPQGPSVTKQPAGSGPRLGTTAPGRPLTQAQMQQIGRQPLSQKPTLLGDIRGTYPQRLGTSAPGRPLTQVPAPQSWTQKPTLLGDIRRPSRQQPSLRAASAGLALTGPFGQPQPVSFRSASARLANTRQVVAAQHPHRHPAAKAQAAHPHRR